MAYIGETASAPKLPTPPTPPDKPLAERYGKLLTWAKGRSLHIDPHLGSAEDPNVRRARHAARDLIDSVERYDKAVFEDGEDPGNMSWTFESAERYAGMLDKLKGELKR